MTVYLNLGVNDVMYAPGPQAPRRAVARIRKGKVKAHTAPAAGQQTTGDVAEILEEKYQILESFSNVYADEISDALVHSVEGAIETMLMGGEPPENPFAGAESEIEESMKLFLDLQEMDGANGVPTKAALKGVNHRLARPNSKDNPARPSFIDTGLMQANYRAWTETE